MRTRLQLIKAAALGTKLGVTSHSRRCTVYSSSTFGIFLVILLASLLGLAALCGTVLANETVTGRASVIDGDTIEIQGVRIRFDGIDSPESGQTCSRSGTPYPCGRQAAFALDEFLAASRPAHCELTGEATYDRLVGTCFRADGMNVSEWLVREGLALLVPRYAKGRFRQEQSEAMAAGRGIWNGQFIEPWNWRRGDRLGGASAADEDCPIKGNVSRDGERIYHVPGQSFYERTRIDENEGERWFCSREQAEAAGWRPARR